MSKRFNRLMYEEGMRRYLYINTHRFTGMPAVDNAWLYPDIKLWGEDEDGDNLIPDFAIIYFNQSYAYPHEKRWALERQLANLIPPRWHCYWFFGEGYIYAERDYGLPSILPETIRNMHLHIVHQYDKLLAETNGYLKEVLEDESVVFVVPQSE
jgi:hypothetical protein